MRDGKWRKEWKDETENIKVVEIHYIIIIETKKRKNIKNGGVS